MNKIINFPLNTVNVLTIAILVLLHFKFFSVLGFNVTFVFLFFWVWLYRVFEITYEVNKFHLLVYLFAVALPLVNIEIEAFLEFVKTYLLYLFFITGVFVVVSYKIKQDVNSLDLARAISFIQVFIVSYVVLQYILLSYFGSTILYNPWGNYQFHQKFDVDLHDSYGKIRATGFYLEPSVLGLVLTSMFWVRHILESRVNFSNVLLTVMGLVVASSMGGWSVFLLVILFYYLSLIRSTLVKLIIILGLSILVFSAFELIPRATDIYREGSSLYWRFVVPLLVMLDTLPSNLFGMPFGSIDEVISSYGFFLGDKVGDSIDNGHLVLLYYFGLLTIPLYSYIFYIYYIHKDYVIRSMIIFSAGNFLFAGSIFNIEYAFLMIFLPLFIVKLKLREVNESSIG